MVIFLFLVLSVSRYDTLGLPEENPIKSSVFVVIALKFPAVSRFAQADMVNADLPFINVGVARST